MSCKLVSPFIYLNNILNVIKNGFFFRLLYTVSNFKKHLIGKCMKCIMIFLCNCENLEICCHNFCSWCSFTVRMFRCISVCNTFHCFLKTLGSLLFSVKLCPQFLNCSLFLGDSFKLLQKRETTYMQYATEMLVLLWMDFSHE